MSQPCTLDIVFGVTLDAGTDHGRPAFAMDFRLIGCGASAAPRLFHTFTRLYRTSPSYAVAALPPHERW